MIPRPGESEANPYLFTYIDKVTGDNPLATLETQLEEAMNLFGTISEQASLHRYQPEKWSIRELLNHVTDTERIFAYRLLWIARGLELPLPGFEQDIAVRGANADAIPWASHTEEFRSVRRATVTLYRNMPEEGWTRSGTASERHITARALAYIIPGHTAHHLAILREFYLS
jgi:hypothetical protein